MLMYRYLESVITLLSESLKPNCLLLKKTSWIVDVVLYTGIPGSFWLDVTYHKRKTVEALSDSTFSGKSGLQVGSLI